MKFFLTLIALHFGLLLTAQKVNLDISDSVSVKEFISTHSLCNEIDALIQYKYSVIDSNKYGRLLFESIAKQSKRLLLIPIGAHGKLYSKTEQGDVLEEQLLEIQTALNCPGQQQRSKSTSPF